MATTKGTAIFQKYLVSYQYETGISIGPFYHSRIAVFDTFKGREVHSKVALAFILDSGVAMGHLSCIPSRRSSEGTGK